MTRGWLQGQCNCGANRGAVESNPFKMPRRTRAEGASEADGTPTWKSKLSDEQLKRKRQVDRISQRRTRQKSKQVAVQLQEKMTLLSSGDHKGLLERMMAENEELTGKLKHFQTRLDHIHRLSKECLDLGDVSNSAALHRPVGLDSTPMADEMVGDVGQMFSQQPSIFLHIIEQMRDTQSGNMSGLTSNRFIESTMAWKYSQGLTDGLDYLVQYFHLRGFTSNGKAFCPQRGPESLPSGLDVVYSKKCCR